MTTLIATIRDLFRSTPYSGLEYRRKSGMLRGAGLGIVRRHAFSYDVVDKAGQTIGHRYIFTAAENFALSSITVH